MPDISLGQLLVQGWPIMLAAPGIALALLIVGSIAGWCAKAHIVKILTKTLAEKVDVADRHRAYAEARVIDISVKHQTVLAAADGLKADILRLTERVRGGAYSPELSSISASVSKNLETLTTANTDLTSSISSLSLGSGGVNDMLWLGNSPRYTSIVGAGTTNPPTSQPQPPKRPRKPKGT